MTRRSVLLGIGLAVLAIAAFVYITVWRDPTTPGLIGITTTIAPGDEMQCPERSLVMEPSNAQFPSARAAASAALAETIWPQASLETTTAGEWLAREDEQVVVSMTTVQNEDGTWEWGNLEACAGT